MTSFLGSTTLGGTHNANSGGSQLQQRLAAKYQTSLGKFRESIRALNEGVDERQRDRIRRMKMALLDAHAETELMLRTEQETIDEHEELLRSHQEICDIAPPGEVLPALADPFHRCGEVDLVASQERMREERLRIVHLAVVLRQAYEARVAIIQDCVEELEAEEQNRRAVIQTALRELMLTLAKISFTSITGSHVLAQRVIHSVNEQISTNYLAMRTILAQLRRREVFKHLHYTSTLGTIISATLRRMQRSNLWFARTLLQSDVFRRPMSRMRHVEGVCSVSVGARRDGGHFLNSLAVMVRSLRDSREMVEATSEEERQPCGGSIPAGWLRHYSPKVSQPVFPTRPTELVHEWRMRANVVIRNSLAACVALIDEVRREESGISAAAAALCEEVADGIRWVFSPLPEEAEVLRAVSLTPGELDAAYRPFVEVNAEEIGRQRTAAENLLSPVVAAIGEETEWFHNLLNKGLLRSHEVFEQALLAAYMSILRIFEKATEELITTADNVFGFTRSFYHQRYEQRRDYEDVVAMLDANFSTIGEKLLHAGSRAAAEELFGEGLACLDEIAAAHSRFHHQTMRDVGGIIELVRANAATYCGRLQKKIGVEAVVETEARLTDERAAKMQAALQQLLQEYHSHARRKGRKAAAGDDGAATAPTMDMVENIPLEEVAYPQFSALNGCTYNIVGPLALLEAEVEHHKPEPVLPSTTTSSRSKRASSKRRSTGDSASSHRRRNVDRSTDASAVATPDLRAATEVSANFITTYEAFFRESILNDENFVSVADLDAWKEVLRVELLNWLVALRESAVQYIDAYCVRVREESNREINELLRRHRRRPAAFQADFYEARVRELEDIVSSSERSCARLRDKVAKVDAMVVGLKRGVVVAEEGRKLSEALAAVETKTGEAPSISILQVQERRFASLADHYRDSFASQAHATIDAVEKMRANIEEECMQLLQDRARDIAREEHGGTSPEEAIERDPITQRARAVLQKLRDAVEQLHLFTTEERELRERTVEAARERYDGLCARNVAELSLFAKVQELFGHLKTQVQGVLLASKTGEGELEKLVAALEERVKKSASRVNLAATMKSIVRYDHSLDSSANTAVAAEELSPDEPDKALEDLHEHLRLCTVALQRTLQSCEAAEVLGLVDQLREQLFVRGASLGALVCAVEMVKIIPDNYIEPRAMTEKEVAEMAAAAPAGQSRSGRKAKGGKSAAQALQLSPLPVVQTIEHQVRHWIAKTKGDILALVQTHMEAFEPPLTRRLQGMCGGSAEDVANYIDVSCKTQEERARQHVATALAVYHQHVLRIHAVVENLPQFLAAAIYAFSATAVERRVESVLRVFGNFYRHSSILKGRHQRVVKVSLGSKYNRETLMQLTEVEAMRQRMTEEMIARFWGFAIRELQDEAGLHVVRCHHTATTLFNLLKGLITPEHLTPVEMGVPVGHHRGLKHLLQMRAKDGKVKDGQTSNGGGGKKEKKNAQDGPLLKQDASQRNRANMAAVGDSSALPSPAYAEADYPGLPLHTFRPLEAFNDENPAYVLHAPMAARLFYPTNTAATDAAQPNRKGGARGRKTQEMPEEAIALSPSFTAPSTRVHQEVIARARESVAVFQATAQEVVEDTMRSFRSWVQREAQWRDGWALTVNRLRGGSSIGPRAGPPGGLRLNPPGSPNTATAKS